MFFSLWRASWASERGSLDPALRTWPIPVFSLKPSLSSSASKHCILPQSETNCQWIRIPISLPVAIPIHKYIGSRFSLRSSVHSFLIAWRQLFLEGSGGWGADEIQVVYLTRAFPESYVRMCWRYVMPPPCLLLLVNSVFLVLILLPFVWVFKFDEF